MLGRCLNCDSFDLVMISWDCFFGIVSSLAEPGSGIVSGPGDEGVEEVFAVGEGVVGAAPLQVFMDRHEGMEPEASGGYPADERMGPGRGLAVGAGRRRLAAMLFGQPAEPEDGELGGQFRWRARTRALRSCIGLVYLVQFAWWIYSREWHRAGAKILIRRTFPDIPTRRRTHGTKGFGRDCLVLAKIFCH